MIMMTSFLFSGLPEVPHKLVTEQFMGRARWNTAHDDDNKVCPDYGGLPSVGGNERYPLESLWETTDEGQRDREWEGNCTDGRCVHVSFSYGFLYVCVSTNEQHDPERTTPIFQKRIGGIWYPLTTDELRQHTAHLWETPK